MAIKVSKPEINIREALSDLKQDTGLKGQELMRADTVAEARTAIGAGRKNLIINGGFDVWQRGTADTVLAGVETYVCDRFSFFRQTISKVVENDKNWVKLTGSDSSSTQGTFLQRIEESLSGKTVTASFSIKSSAPMTLDVKLKNVDGTTTYSVNSITTSTSETRYSITTVVPSNSSTGSYLIWYPSLAVGDTFEIAQVQLEVGSVATDFEHRSYGEELALCQRYYQEHSLKARHIFYYTSPWGRSDGSFQLPVEMRVNPTISYRFTAVTNAQPGGGGTSGIVPLGGDPFTDHVNLKMNSWPGYQSWTVNSVSGGDAIPNVMLNAEL